MLLNIILLIIVIISGMILSYYNGFIKKEEIDQYETQYFYKKVIKLKKENLK